MKIIINKDLEKKAEVQVLGIYEEDKSNLRSHSPQLSAELDKAVGRKVFERKFGQIHKVFLNSKYHIVVGLGKKKEFTLERVRRVLGKSLKCAKQQGYYSFTTNIPHLCEFKDEELGRAVAEGLVLSDYFFTEFLNKEKKEKLKGMQTVTLQYKDNANFQKGIKTGKTIAQATNFSKDLVNMPAGVATINYMEKEARKVSKHSKIRIKVLDHHQLKKLGMGSMLGVGQGATQPPRLIILEYHGGKAKWNAIVGKGIVFDSGGYNLKPTHYIEDMHCDMAGSAAVLGTIKAMAELGVKKNIVGVMAMAENMVSDKAQHPGDIVKAYNGKTIQVMNTDAEGRLVLADALAYTENKYHPEHMVDLATLTGACVVGLGYYAAGMVGNDEELQSALFQAGESSGDRVWKLPFYDDFQDWMDGDVSDLKNISSKGKGYEAGSITAGVFLSKFVDKVKWAHLDIAGSGYLLLDEDYNRKHGTGAGVRVLSYWLM
jgi:leucyl aminopeptidase